MGLRLFVENPKERLVTVTPVMVPAEVDDVKYRNQLLDEFNIEIAGGIGPLKGKVWRLGLMGYCAQRGNVLLLLAAMEQVLHVQGARVPAGAGVAAAIRSYAEAETAVGAAKS